jgi:putative FmdB family regulatory protein
MPLYSYKCNECQHEFEETHKVDDRKIPENQPCPQCSAFGAVVQTIGAPRVVYGTGNLSTPDWYKDKMKQLNKESGTSHSPIK